VPLPSLSPPRTSLLSAQLEFELHPHPWTMIEADFTNRSTQAGEASIFLVLSTPALETHSLGSAIEHESRVFLANAFGKLPGINTAYPLRTIFGMRRQAC
jgi:hypothetical protein